MQGYNICNSCIKRNCKACCLAHREPEHISKVISRVMAQIKEPQKELVKADN